MTDITQASRIREAAYDQIDRFLRNNLDDADYADYSRALECLFSTASTPPHQGDAGQPVAWLHQNGKYKSLSLVPWTQEQRDYYSRDGRLATETPLYATPPSEPAAIPAGQGWMPIESAPKDGGTVLLAEGDYVDCGFWHDGSECYGHRGGEGWFSEDDRYNLLTARNIHPTHWMPLPAPPTDSTLPEGE